MSHAPTRPTSRPEPFIRVRSSKLATVVWTLAFVVTALCACIAWAGPSQTLYYLWIALTVPTTWIGAHVAPWMIGFEAVHDTIALAYDTRGANWRVAAAAAAIAGTIAVTALAVILALHGLSSRRATARPALAAATVLALVVAFLGNDVLVNSTLGVHPYL